MISGDHSALVVRTKGLLIVKCTKTGDAKIGFMYCMTQHNGPEKY